jgi:hypothetical protein
MAFGSIEIVSLTRTQDYSTIKHNEDNKGFVNQANIGQQIQKDTEQRAKEVHSGDNVDWHERKFDAKDKGDNEYSGDGGQRRKREGKTEQVIINGHRGFDIKI